MEDALLQQLALSAGLWLLLGFGAAVIAQSKGRDFILWLLIGTAGGLLALIVIAVLPSVEQLNQRVDSDRQREARSRGDSASYRKCPFCAEAIRREAIKCRYCQSDVVPLLSVAGTAEESKAQPVPFYYSLDPSMLATLAAIVALIGWGLWAVAAK